MWAASGQSKVVWLVLQVLLWTLGAVIYFIAIRPKLVAAATVLLDRFEDYFGGCSW